MVERLHAGWPGVDVGGSLSGASRKKNMRDFMVDFCQHFRQFSADSKGILEKCTIVKKTIGSITHFS